MIDSRAERHFGRLEWIIGRELNVEKKYTPIIRRTARTDDGRHPLVQVIPLRSRAAVGRRFERYFRQLFLDSPRAARQRALLVAHRLRCRLSIVVHTVEAFGCVRSVYGFLDRRLTRRRLASSRPRRRRVGILKLSLGQSHE